MNDPVKRPTSWPELIEATPETRAALDRAVAAGELKRLGLGLYTSNLVDKPAEILDRHCRRQILELQRRIDEITRRRLSSLSSSRDARAE